MPGYERVIELFADCISTHEGFRSLCARLTAMGVHRDVVLPLSVEGKAPEVRWVDSITVLKGRTWGELGGYFRGVAAVCPALEEFCQAIIRELESTKRDGLSSVDALVRALEVLQGQLLDRACGRAGGGAVPPVQAAGVPGPRTPGDGGDAAGAVGPATASAASTPQWDVFICHASEDKDAFVRDLAHALRARGWRVWYDQFTLTLGDKLLRKIGHGLSNSSFGVVVLSTAFFGKEWPQKELDGLAALESGGRKVVLPVWHGVEARDVAQFSPILAGCLGVKTGRGLNHVIAEIERAIHAAP